MDVAANVARQRQNVRRRFEMTRMEDVQFKRAIDRALEGHNVFISGQCGTGKIFFVAVIPQYKHICVVFPLSH